jgi:alpha-tubulin suppressor-like RCC1 family protein
LTKGGKLFFWGASYDEGTLPERKTLLPKLVEGELTGKRVIGVSLGGYHMVAVTDTGDCYTWGSGG